MVKGLEAHRRRQLEMRLKTGASWGDFGFVFTMDVYSVVAEERQREASERLAEVFGIEKMG